MVCFVIPSSIGQGHLLEMPWYWKSKEIRLMLSLNYLII
jgi:hypothetical protein